jgi:para-aminobenzoate synthetase component 1
MCIFQKRNLARESVHMSTKVIEIMNQLGRKRKPFLFIVDFEFKSSQVYLLNEVDPEQILYDVNGISNYKTQEIVDKQLEFEVEPVMKSRYKKAFDIVQEHITHGNSFLLNLTMPSRIETNYSLKEIFYKSRAKYKLLVNDTFVVFSPETFVKTNGQRISSFPMKGTIEAMVPDAEKKLLESKKELAEHFTIVDLIRNDLSMVAKNVKVDRFQFIDRLKTNRKELLQMSSEISGELPDNFQNEIGEMLFKILPAGSISGAPKRKTIEVIKEAEKYNRGFYTGVFGIFDGKNIDSAVMIRFIENTGNGLVHKTGGGITAQSNVEEEYKELISKIYIPV